MRVGEHTRAACTSNTTYSTAIGWPVPQTPLLTVRMQPLPDEHTLFHAILSQPSELKSVDVLMVTDTGCQSSVMFLTLALNLILENIRRHCSATNGQSCLWQCSVYKIAMLCVRPGGQGISRQGGTHYP